MENHVYIKKKIAFKSLCNHGRERKGETIERTHRQMGRQTDND